MGKAGEEVGDGDIHVPEMDMEGVHESGRGRGGVNSPLVVASDEEGEVEEEEAEALRAMELKEEEEQLRKTDEETQKNRPFKVCMMLQSREALCMSQVYRCMCVGILVGFCVCVCAFFFC